jgi:putative aldouronate transport system substrate-binding protein
MKKNTRILALVCSLFLTVSLFSGCSNDGTTSSAAPSAAPAQSSAPAESAAPANEYVYKMPIADSVYTLTAWRPFSSTYLTNPNEIICNTELEKRTNIHLEYSLVAATDAVTQFNLMINSGDYTDLVFMGMNGGGMNAVEYAGGMDKAISDNFVLEMSDALNKWMPNLKAYMDNNSDIYKQMHTDSGNLGAIVNIQNGEEPAWVGPMVRKDFMDKVGVSEVPQTYDDLYNLLKKFKDELNVEQPLSINYAGYSSLSKGLTAGFDVDGDFFNADGTVKYGFIEPGFKEYITLVNQWYTEGLIDKDFYTRTTDFAVNQSNMVGDKIGVTDACLAVFAEMWKPLATNPDFHLVGMPLPRKTADAIAHFRRVNLITGTTAIAVTTAVNDADKLEKAARWIDYRFSEEGAVLLNYGIEGQTFSYVEGEPMWGDAFTKDPDGRSMSDMRDIITDGGFGALYDWTAAAKMNSDAVQATQDLWNQYASGDWVMPPVTLTSEEGTEFANIYGDIQTLVTEAIPQFISGQKPMSEFDAFVDQINSMNIARCIELKQAALDRYNNR